MYLLHQAAQGAEGVGKCRARLCLSLSCPDSPAAALLPRHCPCLGSSGHLQTSFPAAASEWARELLLL